MAEATVSIARGDEFLELNITYSIERADPSVGLGESIAPSRAEIYNRSTRAWEEIELSEREWDEVVSVLGSEGGW